MIPPDWLWTFNGLNVDGGHGDETNHVAHNRSLLVAVVFQFLFALGFCFFAFDAHFGYWANHDWNRFNFNVGQFKAIHFFGGQAVFFDEPIPLDDQVIERGNFTVDGSQ